MRLFVLMRIRNHHSTLSLSDWNMRIVAVGISLALGLSLLPAQNDLPVERQIAENPGSGILVPTLGSHIFVLHSNFSNAFITNHIRNSIGVGGTSILSIPPIEVGGTEVEILLGSLLYAQLDFEYQHAVKEWLGVWFRFELTSRLGTETSTLISQGITLLSGFEIGWKARIWQNRSMLLTGTISVHNLNYTVIDMIGFVQRVIQDDGLDPSNTLVKFGPITAAGFGGKYAYGINDLFGVNASFDVLFGESVERQGTDEWYYQLGAVVDMNLVRRTNVPIGLALGYKLSTIPGPNPNAAGNTHSFLFRLAHTRSEDFSVGVDIIYSSTPVSDLIDRLDFTSASLSLGIYF